MLMFVIETIQTRSDSLTCDVLLSRDRTRLLHWPVNVFDELVGILWLYAG